MSLRGIPGFAGIVGIVVGLAAVSAIISFVTGAHEHWPALLAGVLVGWWAVRAINK